MNKLFLIFTFLTISLHLNAQIEKPPTYVGCESVSIDDLESCFNNTLTTAILDDFVVPEIVNKENYKGEINVVFIVNKKGEFEILYINAIYNELKEEVRRVFKELPKVEPATYNGRPVDTRYVIPIAIPIKKGEDPKDIIIEDNNIEVVQDDIQDVIKTNKSLFPETKSELNIPFTHRSYDNIVYNISKSENTHSAFKPYTYNEVKPFVDISKQKTELLFEKNSWFGRKIFNEHLVVVEGDNFWFSLDLLFDLQLGADNSDVDYTYNNTRALQFQGSLGKNFSFFSSFYESQGRFADYVNRYAISHKPNEGFGLVPGRGRGKQFNTNGFDYPVAEGYISYTPNTIFNFQFGHGKNFIGDGYRSLFLSDVTTPSTYLKISTNFWKIKYTNLWMWAKDVRPEVDENGNPLRKYIAIHHLSWNVTKRFNLGFFEAVITDNSNKDGFNIEFFNPIIFYRAIEFNQGSRTGNALIGLDMKYQLTDDLFLYDQILIDEMTIGEVFSGTGYWANKFGFQIGAKYFNAFDIDNLMLQLEYNVIRPYTNSHNTISLNYGHFNQPLSHLWGGNFWEAIFITRYNKDRWFGSAKFTLGEKGYDFDGSDISYGGNIYRSYDDRESDYGNNVGQGNTTNIFIADLQAGYVVNPATNMQLFAGFTYRSFDQLQQTSVNPMANSTWFTVGLRSELFNWYFDF